jgi:hypothetical protein
MLAVLALGLPAAGAQHAAAPILPGDTLHGDIPTPGDEDDLSIYLPGGSVFSAQALPEPGSTILPDLELDDPNGDPVFLDLVKTPGPGGVGVRLRNLPIGVFDGGTYVFRVIAGQGSSGKYAFLCTAKLPKKFSGTPTIGQTAFGGLSFEAPAGSKLKYAVKPVTPYATITMHPLVAPDATEIPLSSFTGHGIALDQDGTWSLDVNNTGSQPAEVSIAVTLTIPPSRRVLYLSPSGFGPPPKVKTITPKRVLDDRPAPGVVISGSGFDPAATVLLEKTGQTSIVPTNVVIAPAGDSITADFDVVQAPPGGWKIVVRNPSGGPGSGTLVVQAAGSVILPAGARAATEVWWLDFDRHEFKTDLAAMGLGSSNPSVAQLAEGAVKSYVVYWLRLAFLLDAQKGKQAAGSVPVSFCIDAPPYTVGTPGAGYDRLSIGGIAGPTDPSTNPNYPWGNGPLDVGNASYDDIGPSGVVVVNPDLGVKTAALVPTTINSIAGYYNAIKPLLDQPLDGSDTRYFLAGFSPVDAADGARYRDIAAAVNAAGREIAGTIAHFVARAMGTADGGSPLSSVPAKVGEYATIPSFSFSQSEINAMTTAANRTGLPGRLKTLRANWFPYRECSGYLLPNATSTVTYSFNFVIGGGRPDRGPTDLQFAGVAGGIPIGYNVLGVTGGVMGNTPLRNQDQSLNGGVFRFAVRMKDSGSGAVLVFGHRINLLVDLLDPSLSPAEIVYGAQLNLLTVNAP